jgi:hypothetical protein
MLADSFETIVQRRRSNRRFDPEVTVADEVIEDYYNDLYENDPPYGTILEHPSKFRKTPSYNIRRKKKKRTI